MIEKRAGKLTAAEITKRQRALGHDWQVIEGHHLEKSYSFKNFRQALDFTNKIGEVAEAMNHHPDIYLTWGKVRVTIFTHTADGLTENDFALAAKFEE